MMSEANDLYCPTTAHAYLEAALGLKMQSPLDKMRLTIL